MADLSRARGPAMRRHIVATIQREQDEAVRAPSGGITEITGGPGTGKTAVGAAPGGLNCSTPTPAVLRGLVGGVLFRGAREDTARAAAAALGFVSAVLDGVTAARLDPPAWPS